MILPPIVMETIGKQLKIKNHLHLTFECPKPRKAMTGDG